MKRLTKSEIASAKRIVNRTIAIANNVSNSKMYGSGVRPNYYGRDKTTAEVKDFVSTNRWIMFPVHNVTSLREGASNPTPNVYISFKDEITDDGNGAPTGWIGLTYNNQMAMEWLKEVLSPKYSPAFMAILNGLKDPWCVEVAEKIKVCHYKHIPEYEPVRAYDPRTITVQDIKDGLQYSNDRLLRPGQYYKDAYEVEGAITIFGVHRHTDPSDFDTRAEEAFDLFFRALSVK